MVSAKHLEDRRREIIAAAEKCFDAKGYAATTMEAVAEATGISKGSIYNYFSSKQDLFTQVFAAACAGDEADYDRLMDQPISAIEKLRQLLDNWSVTLEHHARIGGLVLEFWATAARQGQRGEFSAWFRRMYSDWRGKLTALISLGIEQDQFRQELQPSVAASLILATMDGITIQGILDGQIRIDTDFLKGMKNGMLTALTGKPASESE